MYVGTVEVSKPVPRPVMTLPMTRWGKLNAVDCRMAPIMTIDIASQIVLRLPSLSPTKKLTNIEIRWHVFERFNRARLTNTSRKAAQIIARDNDTGL